MTLPQDKLHTAVADVMNKVIAWRRHLHAHPELSFLEYNTAQFVYDALRPLPGLEVSRPTRTSVLAKLVGKKPGKTIALRADMDALPIQEEHDFDFVSQAPGVMHACGHDGHTAILLGVAMVLSELTDDLTGEVRLIFQHAEELYPGGAEELVRAGVMEGVDVVLGAHLWAPLPVGLVAVTPGPLLAAPDTFHITIRGSGGHAAEPQKTVDPIAVGAQVVVNLQHICSRYKDPFLPGVVSVTQFVAGTADNVIPETSLLAGTVRTFDRELREQIPEQMKRIVQGVCAAHGATMEWEYQLGYRAVVNNEAVTDRLRAILLREFGESGVTVAKPTMGGEDFSAYLAKVPGSFFLIGAGNTAAGIVHPHHHPRFTVDEAALAIGVRAYVRAVVEWWQA